MSDFWQAALLVVGGISLFTGSAGSLFLFLAGPVDDTLVARKRFTTTRSLALCLVGIGAVLMLTFMLQQGR